MLEWSQMGLKLPEMLLPKGVDMSKWAVVACDQYTSQSEYWESLDEYVGDSPSTLRLILPEVYLNSSRAEQSIEEIFDSMDRYSRDLLRPVSEGSVLVERRLRDKTRTGLMMCVDLERYDYQPGAAPLVRCTEGTIVERIPPRLKIREKASLELPHALLLIDDPNRTVIEPLIAEAGKALYDFELNMGGGHITGKKISPSALEGAREALSALYEEAARKSDSPMLFAVGDGNHSLATAKAHWEALKGAGAQMDNPARYTLVEIVNVHDEAIEFEPIHRVFYDADGAFTDFFDSILRKQNPGGVTMYACQQRQIEHPTDGYMIEFIFAGGAKGAVYVSHPSQSTYVGVVQAALDEYLSVSKSDSVDYVHGDDVAMELARKEDNIVFMMPVISKQELFPAIMRDGALPRKAFSIGEAYEKRYYIECRKIK